MYGSRLLFSEGVVILSSCETEIEAFNFSRMLSHSAEKGWSAGQATSRTLNGLVENLARHNDFELVANRVGQGEVDTLKPMLKHEAPLNSISSRFGYGEQPFHTDGAHHRDVPEIILLWSKEPSPVTTRMWRPRTIPFEETRGIFAVQNGREAWLSSAYDHDGGLRFDPGCMSPLDHFARQLARRLSAPPPGEVTEFRWDRPNLVLLLRNRMILHGRSRVAVDQSSREIQRVMLMKGER